MSWLLDTLVWTGALIALVLLLRRPVARIFGAQAAYALWLLPMARLVLPPFVLPAWMAPVAEAQPAAPTDDIIYIVATTPVEPDTSLLSSIDWGSVLLAVWLTGALAFIVARVRAYCRMRDVLLANSANVGEVGKVRLVETPLIEAPIAFGVRERIVALPEGFLDRTEARTRDLALDHELAHHRGRDLLANFLVQPLFALHWFNPLGYLGWHALRSDQEAACDARVIRDRTREERIRYAEVIAGFATGPRLALSAPMACPVLGDKSIIHRLRSLTMSDISARRRMASRIGFVAAVLALPLTATISYAEAGEELAAPAPPAPPAAPDAPIPPDAPEAPAAPGEVHVIVNSDGDGDEARTEERVIETVDKDGQKRIKRVKIVHADGKELTDEERAELKAEIAEAMADMHAGLAEAREAHKLAMIHMNDETGNMAKIEVKCDGDEPVTEKAGPQGTKIVMICKTAIAASAINGLKQARDEIAGNEEMDDEIRAQVLKALDDEIAKFKSEG